MTQKKQKWEKEEKKEIDLEDCLQVMLDGEGETTFFSVIAIGKMSMLCKWPNETICWDTDTNECRGRIAGKGKAMDGSGRRKGKIWQKYFKNIKIYTNPAR